MYSLQASPHVELPHTGEYTLHNTVVHIVCIDGNITSRMQFCPSGTDGVLMGHMCICTCGTIIRSRHVDVIQSGCRTESLWNT